MFIKFPSIAHGDKYGYLFNSDEWQGGEICPRMRFFETYGHGLVQHSPDRPITKEFVKDWLISAAAFMLTEDVKAEEDTLTVGLAYILNEDTRVDKIAFASKLVWTDKDEKAPYNKRRFYSMELLKVSSNYDKRHDKRYSELNESHNGSAQSIFNLVLPHYSTGLRSFQTAIAIAEWLEKQDDRRGMDHAAQFVGWVPKGDYSDYRAAVEIREAFDAAQAITKAARLLRYAKCAVGNAERNRERAAEASNQAADLSA
jgi:hypothetical protein